MDHSIFLGSSNLFLDEHRCKRNACVPCPLDFLYKLLVWSVNQTTTIYTTNEQAQIKRFRLNHSFAFRAFNLDHESAMLYRFRKSRIADQLIFAETDNTYFHFTDQSITDQRSVAETIIRILPSAL